MIEAAIIDFDGTLFDSMSIWGDVADIFVKNQGKKPDAEINIKTRQMSIWEAGEYLDTQYCLNMGADRVIEEICKIVKDFYFNQIEPKPGVKDFLNMLENHNVKKCLLTANEDYLVKHCLEKYDLLKYFPKIITCGQAELNKNDYRIFDLACNKLGCEKSKTVVFDDSYYSIKAANEANLYTVGVYDEYEPDFAKVMQDCNFFLSDFSDIKELLEFLKVI